MSQFSNKKIYTVLEAKEVYIRMKEKTE